MGSMATRFLAQGFRQSDGSSLYPCPYPAADLIPLSADGINGRNVVKVLHPVFNCSTREETFGRGKFFKLEYLASFRSVPVELAFPEVTFPLPCVVAFVPPLNRPSTRKDKYFVPPLCNQNVIFS